MAYADSFRELSRSYREELANKENRRREGVSRQQVLEERRLWENRQALCHNLDEMSQIMVRLAAEVFCLTPLSPREERTVTRALKQEGITVLPSCFRGRGTWKSPWRWMPPDCGCFGF